LVVPFAPGGSTDIIARSVGQKMPERLGQAAVIDNKPGAATTIGAEFVARAAPDGHPLWLAPVPFL
jgi:tripartite-type tricarboxylate transporter receptor subunit TctC